MDNSKTNAVLVQAPVKFRPAHDIVRKLNFNDLLTNNAQFMICFITPIVVNYFAWNGNSILTFKLSAGSNPTGYSYMYFAHFTFQVYVFLTCCCVFPTSHGAIEVDGEIKTLAVSAPCKVGNGNIA